MPKLIVLTEQDARILSESLSKQRKQIANSPLLRSAQDAPEPQTPDVYVARTTGGIAGRSGAVVGSAECQVYRILNGILYAVVGLTRIVCNLSEAAISAGSWLKITKTKFGEWLADGVIASTSEADTGTGTAADSVDTGTAPVGDCGIPGVDFNDLDIETEPDYILGVKDGCLVLVDVTVCAETTTGTGSPL